MATSKVQTFIKKLSNSPNVKKVLSDIQNVSEDLQTRMNALTKEDAVKKYKEILSKVAETEKDLEVEVNKVVEQIKKSAAKVEENLAKYRKKAKSAQGSSKASGKSAGAKKTAKKAAKKTAKKASRKKAAQ